MLHENTVKSSYKNCPHGEFEGLCYQCYEFIREKEIENVEEQLDFKQPVIGAIVKHITKMIDEKYLERIAKLEKDKSCYQWGNECKIHIDTLERAVGDLQGLLFGKIKRLEDSLEMWIKNHNLRVDDIIDLRKKLAEIERHDFRIEHLEEQQVTCAEHIALESRLNDLVKQFNNLVEKLSQQNPATVDPAQPGKDSTSYRCGQCYEVFYSSPGDHSCLQKKKTKTYWVNVYKTPAHFIRSPEFQLEGPFESLDDATEVINKAYDFIKTIFFEVDE